MPDLSNIPKEQAPPPLFSIVMPTYRRPELLRGAVRSVQAQTFTDWELIISDDEIPGAETWEFLQQLSASDSRIRVIQHPGSNGQVKNNNFALGKVRGNWVKPLYDDDRLKPKALEAFRQQVDRYPHASLHRCGEEKWINNRKIHSRKGFGKKTLCIPGTEALRRAYREQLSLGTPVQWLIRRDLLSEKEILWEKDARLYTAHDLVWISRLLSCAEFCTVTSRPLIEQHPGADSGTSWMKEEPEKLDSDLCILREIQAGILREKNQPAALPPDQAKDLTLCLRAFYRMRYGPLKEGLILFRENFSLPLLPHLCKALFCRK